MIKKGFLNVVKISIEVVKKITLMFSTNLSGTAAEMSDMPFQGSLPGPFQKIGIDYPPAL